MNFVTLKKLNFHNKLASIRFNSTVPSAKIPLNSDSRQKWKLIRPCLPVTNVHASFLDRLEKDGGEKIITFSRNFLHVHFKRFLMLCDQTKGLSLNDALLQVKWHRKPIAIHYTKALNGAIVKAKKSGLDLDKVYIADAYAHPEALISKTFKKIYIRGRGRYGATPHPITSLLTFTLQEREKPFDKRAKDPLEWIRDRLRLRQKPFVKTAEEVYEERMKLRPSKIIWSNKSQI